MFDFSCDNAYCELKSNRIKLNGTFFLRQKCLETDLTNLNKVIFFRFLCMVSLLKIKKKKWRKFNTFFVRVHGSPWL